MDSQHKTNEHLLKEIDQLKAEIDELKTSKLESKKTEESLNYERKLYLDLANAQPAGIYRLRVFFKEGLVEEKWQNSKESPYVLEFFNDRFYQILKASRLDVENNPAFIHDLVLETDKTEFARKNVEANLKTMPFLWEGRLVIEGETLWVHLESLPRLLKNGDTIWTGILYEITNRKNAELEIKLKNEELQKINAEKDKFFSIIAHDLKSPFNSIIGFSEILSKSVRKNDLKVIEKYADIILRSAHKAMDLLMNLMEWAKSQTGRMIFHPESFEIINIINDSVLLFTHIAEQKSILITTELIINAPVYADKAMISTILRNLISNAIKFTAPGGKIIISGENHQGEVKIKISDTGVGIPKVSMEKLFRIDENYSTYGTQNEYGTGLGLILCKEFVEKNGGIIWAESDEGKGSQFYFTIPNNTKPPIQS